MTVNIHETRRCFREGCENTWHETEDHRVVETDGRSPIRLAAYSEGSTYVSTVYACSHRCAIDLLVTPLESALNRAKRAEMRAAETAARNAARAAILEDAKVRPAGGREVTASSASAPKRRRWSLLRWWRDLPA